MSTFKLEVMVHAAVALLGVTLVGCIAETTDDVVATDELTAGDEPIGEAEQALDTCTPYGSGGGTWGDILKLCVTPDMYLYVQKRDGTPFNSSGVMKLKNWTGEIMSTNVFLGTRTVYFGPHFPSEYQAVFESTAPGTAWTGWLYLQDL